MNVSQLEASLREAREKGLHPDTEVVIDMQDVTELSRWYCLLDPEVSHPVDGKEDADLWFTMSPVLNEGGEMDTADARFTPGHSTIEDPILHGEYLSEREESHDPDSILFDSGFPESYVEWLQDRYEGCVGALRDDPPKAGNRSGLADTYHALSIYLRELERIDPS